MENNKNSILYIDDERENLVGFKYVFKKHYNVLIASSADEGWDILKNNEIKVVISDQRMPKTTGIQLLERAANEFPKVYRIILTGYTDVQDIIEAINKGKIFQYIRKPWDKDEVKVIIDNAIKLYDLKEQNRLLIETLKDKNIELEDINKDLEKIIKQRTKKIEIQNKELEKHRNHLEEEVVKRTKELEIAKNKAEESDRLKTSFLANVSHEIRTPMNAIIGFSELILCSDYSEEEKEEFKKNIYLNSETLLRLIDDILDISKIEANQVTINYEKQNLTQIMGDLYQIFTEQKNVLEKNEIELKYDQPNCDNCFILTDRIRLNQILSNLLSNAIKFTDKGEISFGFNLVTNKNEKMIRFHVCDSGIGIPEDAGNYIFDRFRKAENEKSRLFRGAGLGLSICKSLVDKFKGNIWCEAAKDHEGTCFYFEIPFIEIDINENAGINENKENIPKINGEKINLFGKTIVVAEDEDSTYYYIEKVLRDTKANLFWAKNGKESLDLVTKLKNIDLILMDIQMPEMNGYEAVTEIKKINQHIPVIAQTAYAYKDEHSKILESGFDDFIPKPYKSTDLMKKIRKFILPLSE